MAQYNTTGGGYIENQNKTIYRKVVITTDGSTPKAPESQGMLTNTTIVDEPGGTKRGTFEFTIGAEDGGGAGGGGAGAYSKRVELMGGTREVPIYDHPKFKELTEGELAEVQTAVENKQSQSWTWTAQEKLYGFLMRGTEFFLAPSVVGRVTQIESQLPDLSPIGKKAEPPELSSTDDTFWICTGIQAQSVGYRFEVTREYTLSYSAWEFVEYLYS